MYKAEREMFRQALSDAFVRKYERELSECRENALCSEAHTRLMEEILRQGAEADRKKHRRKWIAALLAAAALLLAACPVYANHAKIREFIEKVYEKYILITFIDSSSAPEVNKIAEKYTLGYVPEGYVSTLEQHLSSYSRCEWKNSEGHYIIFEQCSLDSTNFTLDNEAGETVIITCGNYNVYCKSSDNFTYIWNDGIYSLKIMSSVLIPDEVLIRIIDGIDIVE